MAEAVDLIKEFKSAKPPEKAVIILGVVAVGGVAFYLWKKGNTGQTGQATAQSGQTGGQAAGFPTTAAGTPVLPAGINPVFDQNGNLIAFQPAPAPAPPPPPVQTGPNQLTREQLLKGEAFRPGPRLIAPSVMIPSNTMVARTALRK